MKYLAFAFDDANKTVEIVIIKNARNITEARLELKHLIETSTNPALRIGDVIYAVNPLSTIDAICAIALNNGEMQESIFNKQKATV